MPFGGAPKCPLCGKSVYAAEKATGPGGDWHKACLKCPDCNKLLDSTTVCEHEGKVWCKACYGRRFGPKGYGFAGGASMMHCEGGAPAPASPYAASPAAAAPAAAAPAASAPSAGKKFCSGCGFKLDGGAGKFCPECGGKL